MVMRSLARGSLYSGAAALWLCFAVAGPNQAGAATLEKADCERLENERKALLVLGIDKYFENGIEWAKANLTVADLNLVQRYLHVYEQLTFRCQEEIEIVGGDLDDDEEETAADGPAPPLPVRRPDLPKKKAEAGSTSLGSAEAATGSLIKIGPALIESVE